MDSISKTYIKRIKDRLIEKRPPNIPDNLTPSINIKELKKRWKNRNIKKNNKVDREHAEKQILLWCGEKEEKITDYFYSGIEPKADQVSNEFFTESIFALARKGSKTGNLDEDSFFNWWNDKEVPRLLYRYHAYLKNNNRLCEFSRYGFIEYLNNNINKKYAIRDFIRATSLATDFIAVSAAMIPPAGAFCIGISNNVDFSDLAETITEEDIDVNEIEFHDIGEGYVKSIFKLLSDNVF